LTAAVDTSSATGTSVVVFNPTFRKAEVVESGPARAVVRLTRDYLKPGTKKDFPTENFPSSFFTQDVVLYDGIDRVDFVSQVDWWEEHTMLKVAFPVSVADSSASYEIPLAEDPPAWIVRWYDTGTGNGTATVTLPFTPKRVLRTNFLEEDGEPIPASAIDKNVLTVPTPGRAVVTIKVER